MAFNEWKLIHKNHARLSLGEVKANGLTYEFKLGQVGTVTYNIPLGHSLAYKGYTSPYYTDWELRYGTTTLMAGLHTDVGVSEVESGTLQVTGKDWSHYFEKLLWPFDPTNPVAHIYLASQRDLFLVVKDILDTALAQTNALDFTYALAAVGYLIDYQIIPIDTETIWSKLGTLGQTGVGFDWKVTPDRNIIFGSPKLGSQNTIKLSQGKNIKNLSYTNHGPTATWLLMTASIGGVTQGAVSQASNQVDTRLLMNAVDIGDAASAAFLGSRSQVEAATEAANFIEFSCDVYVDTDENDYVTGFNIGDLVHVDGYISPNGFANDSNGQRWYYDYINDWYRLVGINGEVSDDKVTKLTLTFDDATLTL